MVSNFIAHGAAAYDRYMGRWSRRLAPLFLDFAGSAAGERVVDVGCGTGSLSLALVERAAVKAIEAIDFEPDFVTALQAKIGGAPIMARQGDACSLPFADASFDRALSLLVLHFVSDAQQAAREMRRVVRPGGTVAVSVWDTYGGMPSQRMFWDTVAAIEPSAAARRAATMFRPATQLGDLPALLNSAGLIEIRESLLTIRMEFADFEDYWHPLLTAQGNLGQFVDGLAAPTRTRVIEAVRAAFLSGRPDGPRSFASVAWAARGVVPG
jgi:ubiquinone/menaquinone biosynthesis C-methylase UbiE